MGKAPNGWKVEDGILRNDTHQESGKHVTHANLRTEKEFEDSNLTLEFRVPKNDNSGALYSRIMPGENVSKAAGEWQTFDITLVNRHLHLRSLFN